MKTMKFRAFKADMILRGEKTASIRLFDDKSLQSGDDLELINSDSGEIFAHATISEVIEKPLEKITEADLVGHESYESKEVMYKNLGGHYKDTDVGPMTMAKIVRFQVISKITNA